MSKAGNVRSDTDWDSVTVLTKKGPAVKTLKTQAVSARVQDLYFNRAPIQDINAAKRSGTEIDTSKKFAAGSNKQHAGASNATKLDAETDANHIPTVPLDVGRAIQQARQTKEWTQKELAQVGGIILFEYSIL
jgi:putative transcription factor